jgi:hypothetical protein
MFIFRVVCITADPVLRNLSLLSKIVDKRSDALYDLLIDSVEYNTFDECFKDAEEFVFEQLMELEKKHNEKATVHIDAHREFIDFDIPDGQAVQTDGSLSQWNPGELVRMYIILNRDIQEHERITKFLVSIYTQPEISAN